MTYMNALTPARRRRLLGRARVATLGLLACLALVLATLALNAERAAADTVHLRDGSVLEGEVKKLGSSYMVKTLDGQMRLINESEVTKVDVAGIPGGGAAVGGAAAKPGLTPGGKPAATPSGFTRDYYDIKKRADNVEEPVRAVTLWERHLQRKDLSDTERAQVETELKQWKTLYQENAEKVKGKWMQGDDLKKLKDEADGLVEEGLRLEQGNGSIIDATRNYQKAIRMYPNMFLAHFRLGYLELKQGQGQGGNAHLKAARRSLDAALRLEPENPAVLSNYGACMWAMGEFPRGVDYLWKATQKAETETIVGNLLNVLDAMPGRFYANNPQMREINLRANGLRERYHAGPLLYITDPTHGLDKAGESEDEDRGPPGLRGNGSGFFVTADGFLITNRHVAKTDDGYYYRVRLADKDAEGNYVEYLARFIAADDKYDIALLKVDFPEGKTVPFVHLIKDDYPPVQADVLTLGYPTTGTQGFNLQVSRGQITTVNPDGEKDYDVYMDIKGTQGNSGGPVVDRDGQVVGILSAYRKVYDSIITMAIGPRQIRDFLKDVAGAPELTYDTQTDRPFDAQKLTQEVRPKTLLVLIFRGNINDANDDAGGDVEGKSDGKSGSAGGAGQQAPTE